MALIRLIEGPVGVGKSTFASQICTDCDAYTPTQRVKISGNEQLISTDW